MTRPILTITDVAWSHIHTALHAVETEIGMILVPSRTDRLCIVGIDIPQQIATAVHINPVPSAMAEMQCALEAELTAYGYDDPCLSERYWLHTHPGNSAEPSSTDIADFRRRQKLGYPFLVHVIIARGGARWARIDNRIEGTDQYIETEMSIVVEPSYADHIAELAVTRCTEPPTIPVAKTSAPIVYAPPKTIIAPGLSGKRIANRQAGCALAWNDDFYDDIPPCPLSDGEYRRFLTLHNMSGNDMTDAEWEEYQELESRLDMSLLAD